MLTDNLINVIAWTLQGDIGGYTFYTSARRQIVFFPVAPPRMPATWIQQHQREKFRLAATAWQALDQSAKDDYKTACKIVHAQITPYNLWISAALKDYADLEAIERKTGLSLARPWD